MIEESRDRVESSRVLPTSVSITDLLEGGSDLDFRAFIHDLVALSLRVQEIFNRHAKHLKAVYRIDLSSSQLTCLTAVSRLQMVGPVLIRDLAEYMRVSPSFISMETSRLVDEGMLLKTQSTDDLRVQVLEVTAEGWEVLEVSSAEKLRVNDIWFAGVDRARFRELQESVEVLLTGANEAILFQRRLELESQSSNASPAKTDHGGA